MRPALRLAQEVGEGLGGGALLLRPLPRGGEAGGAPGLTGARRPGPGPRVESG
ncbi:MAG: hypothetical protein AAF763_16915, partial [Pseudomonadota bacterium]